MNGQAGNSTELVICFKWCTVIITATAADEIISSRTLQDFSGWKSPPSDPTAVGEKLNIWNKSTLRAQYTNKASLSVAHPHTLAHRHTHCLSRWIIWLSGRQMISVTHHRWCFPVQFPTQLGFISSTQHRLKDNLSYTQHSTGPQKQSVCHALRHKSFVVCHKQTHSLLFPALPPIESMFIDNWLPICNAEMLLIHVHCKM